MTKPKPPAPDPIAEIKAELADYDRQRTEAQQNLAAWQQKMFMADGAFQACAALLKKLESKSQEETAPAS